MVENVLNKIYLLFDDKKEDGMKIKPPTPEEFYEHMLEIKEFHEDDPEQVHASFDEYICNVLRAYGFDKGVEVFENTEMWYS